MATKAELELALQRATTRIYQLENQPYDIRVLRQTIVFGNEFDDRLTIVYSDKNKLTVFCNKEVFIAPLSSNSFTLNFKD
jgi:hypothetical protein